MNAPPNIPAAFGDIDTVLDALRGLQLLVDGAEDLPEPLRLAALLGLIADRLQAALAELGFVTPSGG